jgi:hypothetical protein
MDLFEKSYIESLGFDIIKDNGEYGKAESKKPKGKILLSWNREGADIDYFGNKIEDENSFFGIKDDGGTRTTFNGIVFNRDQIELLLKLTC